MEQSDKDRETGTSLTVMTEIKKLTAGRAPISAARSTRFRDRFLPLQQHESFAFVCTLALPAVENHRNACGIV